MAAEIVPAPLEPEPQTPRHRQGADLQQPRCRLFSVPGGEVSSRDGASALRPSWNRLCFSKPG
jgi:hypothetical protein